jgi:ABC-2 type transport system permease protein
VMTLVAVFAAIFASISIIEDRRDGWLQSVLASPAPRWSIAMGKIAGGGVVAWVQAAILLPTVLLLDATLTVQAALLMLAGLAAVSVAMAAMGVAFAWKCETTGSFHAVMNLVFMPMWLLSGAFFPAYGAAEWMRPLILINPLTWATHAIRLPLLGEGSMLALGISCAFAIAMILLAISIVGRVRK